MLDWDYEGLTGTIPSEIGALSALQRLSLNRNKLSGSIPPTIGALIPPEFLQLGCNPLSGVVPSTLSNFTNLESLWLNETALTNALTSWFNEKRYVQDYLLTLWRPQALSFINHSIAITKKRQDTLAPTPAPHPFFAFLTRCEDATDHILPCLDPVTYVVSSQGLEIHPSSFKNKKEARHFLCKTFYAE